MAPSVTLALVGDVMLGRVVNRMIAEHGFAYPWGDLLPAVRGADCFLINLECALTDHTERWRDGGHKPFYFRANPRVVETLRVAGVDFASLANNHAADFGMTGLLDTVRHLDEAGIAHAGAGGDLAGRAGAGVLDRRRVAHWRRRVCRPPRRLGRGSDLAGDQLHAGLARVPTTSQPSNTRWPSPAGRPIWSSSPSTGDQTCGPDRPRRSATSPAA